MLAAAIMYIVLTFPTGDMTIKVPYDSLMECQGDLNRTAQAIVPIAGPELLSITLNCQATEDQV